MPSITDLMNANRGTCRSCHAPVVWAITKTGRKMPTVVADGEFAGKGNIRLKDRGDGELSAEQVKPGEGTRISHHANCPNSAAHRKAKR